MSADPTVAKAIRYITCPYCFVKAGQFCESMTSLHTYGAWYVHDARRRPFVEEYLRGFWRGMDHERSHPKKERRAKSA